MRVKFLFDVQLSSGIFAKNTESEIDNETAESLINSKLAVSCEPEILIEEVEEKKVEQTPVVIPAYEIKKAPKGKR